MDGGGRLLRPLTAGATGGVGSLAIDMLSALGYRVIALSGKEDSESYLLSIGASQMLLRQSVELGIEYWAAVMEPQLLRMLALMGIRFQPIGPLVSYHGLRQPSFCHLPVMVRNMALTRPESWAVVTNNGELMPTRPDSHRVLRKVA